MDMSRCDDCCEKLDGVGGDTVYVLSCEAMDLFDNDYEHLCEDCMDNLNSDEEILVLKKEQYQTIIDIKGLAMDIDERQMEHENHSKDILHEEQMRDEEYFMEWTINNFHFSKAISLCDVIDVLTKHCYEHDQDVKVLFKMMGEV